MHQGRGVEKEQIKQLRKFHETVALLEAVPVKKFLMSKQVII